MRYPVKGPLSVIDCPVHSCTVALDAAGRVSTPCPRCILEARIARRLLGRKRRRVVRYA